MKRISHSKYLYSVALNIKNGQISFSKLDPEKDIGKMTKAEQKEFNDICDMLKSNVIVCTAAHIIKANNQDGVTIIASHCKKRMLRKLNIPEEVW